MAALDYGALVKKNGILITDPNGSIFQNYSTLSYGREVTESNELKEKKFYREGDESLRKNLVWHSPEQLVSVIGNYMAVVGDSDYLVATYKATLIVCDKEQCLDYWYLDKDNSVVKRLVTPFGTIKIKSWTPGAGSVGVATFNYKGDFYEILFGYGIDPSPKYTYSKRIEKYLGKKLANKVRRWLA